MATLLKLTQYTHTPEYAALLKKISVALAKKAVTIGNLATPSAAQVAWCKDVLRNPGGYAPTVAQYVLAANAAFTIAQINAVTDAAIETAVGTAVDKLLSL